ncbi:hypothetical protein [Mycobacterium sp. GA-1841]|uniref:hypothetical protein n=1 Tax=Mycobacterium sp. GA-1841 TaxID=1834154 RepID=UPI0011156B3F|nr:hypothetical protein [Mycobacterium sp. GA-1841]
MPIAIRKFSPQADLIEICSFRKRILPYPAGVEAKIFPTLREFDLEYALAEDDVASQFSWEPGSGFLVAQPLYFKNTVYRHYASIYRSRDFHDYTSIAVEMNVLDSCSASQFLAAKHFIPGGVELGIFPRSWLVDVLSKLEAVGRVFLERYGYRVREYDKYQVRAVGFLSERLGSFLLIRHLMDIYSNHIPADVFGYMTVIVNDGSRYSAGLGDVESDRPDRFRLKIRNGK